MTVPEFKRSAILALLRAGVSWNKIMSQEKVSHSTVARLNRTLHTPGRKKVAKTARPLPTIKKQELTRRRRLVRELARTVHRANGRSIPLYASAVRITEALNRDHGFDVSRETVNRDLLALGLKCYVRPRRTYKQDELNLSRRKNFANLFTRKYGRLIRDSSNLYDNIVFSDETYFDTNDNSSRTQRAYRKDQCLPREVINRFNIPYIMVWGAIGVGYKSKLERINLTKDSEGHAKRMNAQKYVRMLGHNGVLKHCIDNGKIFQQDGARCHTSGSTIRYITATKRVVLITDWPASSPDLNPIENLWSLLKCRVALHGDGPATDADELWRRVQQVWGELDQKRDIDPLCRSFKARLSRVRCGGM